MPAFVAKAEAPTKGAWRSGCRFRSSSKARDERVSSPSDASEIPVSNRDGVFGLQRQRADERDEVGVAAALAEAVERALDLARAGLDRGKRVRDRAAAIVMGVDAELVARDGIRHVADDALDLVRQRAAIGVAQDDPARAGLVRRAGAGERVGPIGLVAVEEMLAIDDDLAAARERRRDRVADAVEVLLRRRLERDADVVAGGLGDEADRIGIGVEQRRDAGVVRGRPAGALRHAEGGELRVLRALLGEEARIERVRAGIPALDIVEPEAVEQRRDRALVLEREVDARRLRAVAQRRVEEIEAVAGHGFSRTFRARCLLFESSSRSTSLFEHDLFRKPGATFRDHALDRSAPVREGCFRAGAAGRTDRRDR